MTGMGQTADKWPESDSLHDADYGKFSLFPSIPPRYGKMRHIYVQARKMRQGPFEIDVTEYDIEGIIVCQLTPVVFFLQPDVTRPYAGRICQKPPSVCTKDAPARSTSSAMH